MAEILRFNDALVNNDQNKVIIHRKGGFCCLSTHNPQVFTHFNSIILSEHDLPEDTIELSPGYDSPLAELGENIDSQIIIPINSFKDMGMVQKDRVTGFVMFQEDPSLVKIIVVIEENIDKEMLLRLFLTANEAKKDALISLDVRSMGGDILTGKEDFMMLASSSTESPVIEDFGSLQKEFYQVVKQATINALLSRGYPKNILEYIEGVGVTVKDLVDAGMELCVGVEKTEEIEIKLHNQIMLALEDINVISFIMAGIRVEEDYMKHRIRGVDVDEDPAYLYADEVIGMSIANQIAGTKAIFNFKRYDEAKPGIIANLGPILDDVFAGIVAGCMSKIFEEV